VPGSVPILLSLSLSLSRARVLLCLFLGTTTPTVVLRIACDAILELPGSIVVYVRMGLELVISSDTCFPCFVLALFKRKLIRSTRQFLSWKLESCA